MYKKQMTAQRVICLLSIFASVIVFLYSLGLMTDLYDSLYPTMLNPYDLTDTDVPGSIIYYDMQPFNRALLRVSIGLILLSCLLFITNTNVRRKYYVGNYAAVGLNVAANIGVAVWAHAQLTAFKAQFLKLDFDALQFHAELWETPYIDSTFWFDAHYAVFAITLAVTALLILNTIWKMKLMKEEKQLLEAGKAVSA
ncbi:MAG: hypothetical protein IKR36_02300 [Clostridia bacterium]|nr:hypothetical protein [Clostridia bacterium]